LDPDETQTIETCPECGGTGFAVRLRGDVPRASRCRCQAEGDAQRRLANARIPARYGDCRLETFVPQRTVLQAQAKAVAARFVEEYPVGTGSVGLLFLGRPGVGKTHLAVSVLRSLILDKGVQGIFYDYGDLLRTIQSTWDRDSERSESEVLDPVTETEVLLLDDLGATRPSVWVQEILFHILNRRYNDNRVTLLTSNHLDVAHEAAASEGRARDLREASLEHQVGIRLRSRLHEMCRTVPMDGEDFRKTFKRADFSA